MVQLTKCGMLTKTLIVFFLLRYLDRRFAEDICMAQNSFIISTLFIIKYYNKLQSVVFTKLTILMILVYFAT